MFDELRKLIHHVVLRYRDLGTKEMLGGVVGSKVLNYEQQLPTKHNLM